MNRRESIFAMFLGMCGLRTKLPEKKDKVFKQTWRVVSINPNIYDAQGNKSTLVAYDETTLGTWSKEELEEYLKLLSRHMTLSGQSTTVRLG